MHTFVLVASASHPPSSEDLRSYAEVIRRAMPCLGVALAEGRTLVPECGAGWVWLAPVCTRERPLISEHVDDEFAVVTFGETFGDLRRDAAEAVLAAWRAGGAFGVSRTEGSFAAAIAHRASGRIVLVGDAVGHRALRYHAGAGTLIASPHEVSLVATGRCPTAIDYVSASSIVAAGWSLGGRSLLTGVHPCRATEYVEWRDGDVRIHRIPSILQGEDRIDGKDTEGIARQHERMIEAMRSYTRLFTRKDSVARTTLTAGLDSRVVLSLLLAELGPRPIQASCGGEPNSLDVKTARRVVERQGVAFSSAPLLFATPDEFIAHADLLAFAMNGDTDGKRAAYPPPRFDGSPQNIGGGWGGEVTRGFYYRGSPFAQRAHVGVEHAAEILKNVARSPKLPWACEDLVSGLEERSEEGARYYAAFSEDGYDILDLFYLHDRVAVWGALLGRFTWKERHWSPFLSLRLLELAGAMPAPIGDRTHVHEECIRRFAPRSYWISINGKTLLPLERPGQVARALRLFNRKWQALLQGRKGFRLGRLSAGSDQLRSTAFAGPLSQAVRDVLTSEGSFAFELFGRAGTERLLREPALGAKNHIMQALGTLLIMERWRTLVTDVAGLSH